MRSFEEDLVLWTLDGGRFELSILRPVAGTAL